MLTTDPIRVADPAAITDASSSVLAYNVFQRLMTADPGESVLKPDAARDCLFTTATTYTCTLNEDLTFHNGHPLTAADVKFSIERAARLDVAGSSAPLLSSLRRIETSDDLTVRFLLSRPDTQFGWALASPAASIVDAEVYDADRVREPEGLRRRLGAVCGREAGTSDELLLARYPDYVGRTPARLAELAYRTVADSATIEDAMTKGTVEVVWRGLDTAAITRLQQQVQQSPEEQTESGYRPTVLTGVRVLQLQWSPESRARSSKALRTAIALALQGDRTSRLAGPGRGRRPRADLSAGRQGDAQGHLEEPDQPDPGLRPEHAQRPRPRRPDPYPAGGHRRAQRQARARRARGGPRSCWTARRGRPRRWPGCSPTWTHHCPTSRRRWTRWRPQFRGTTEPAAADRLLAVLQRQSALDLVMLPISQSDEYLYARAGVEVSALSFGPGWQLGLWGIGSG